MIAWIDGPYVMWPRWPHMNPWAMIPVCVGAGILWFWYFVHAWRGRALLGECWRRGPANLKAWLWLIVIVLLFVLFWTQTQGGSSFVERTRGPQYLVRGFTDASGR
jgi:hypothetical protein